MTDIQIGKAPPNAAVLPYYVTGAFAFLCLSVLLFLSSDALTGHYFNPHLLTLVHVAALGWGSMVIFGAAYQLLPVICEKDLYSAPLAISAYFLLTIGTLLLTYAFWDFKTGILMISGGACVVLAVICYLINVMGTAGRFQRYTIQKAFLASSACWLLLTTTIGLLLAINLAYPFFSRNHLDVLKLHTHAGLVGWFLQLITGVSTKLVPMFLLGKSAKTTLLRLSFAGQNIGVTGFIADAYLSGTFTRAPIYTGIVLIAVCCWLIYLYDAYKNRVRRKTDLLMKHTFVSFLCLLLAFVALGVSYSPQKGHSWIMLYGIFLFMGWISSLILGMTFKTLPFIVWNTHYKMLSGKVKVPLPKDLYSERLVTYQFYLLIVGLLLLTTAVLLQWHLLLRIALFTWIILAFVYVYNLLQVMFHKTDIRS